MRRSMILGLIASLAACAPTLEYPDGQAGSSPEAERIKSIAMTYCRLWTSGDWAGMSEIFEPGFASLLQERRDEAVHQLGPASTCKVGRALYLGGSRSFAEVLTSSGAVRLDLWRSTDGLAKDVLLPGGRSLKAALTPKASR